MQGFRKRLLGDRLLKPDEMHSWLTGPRKKEPSPECQIIVKVPRANLQRTEAKWDLDPPFALQAEDIVGLPG